VLGLWISEEVFSLKLKVKVKLSLTSCDDWVGGKECLASVLTLTFGTIRTAELSAGRSGPTLHPRKLVFTHFC